MKHFSSAWKRSRQARKQRKYIYNAPLHIRHKFMAAHLSPELRKKYGKRSIPLRKGDTVKVMRGKFKGKSGRIDRVDLKNTRVYIQGVEIEKKDGSKILYPIQPSKLLLTSLELDDKKRKLKVVQK